MANTIKTQDSELQGQEDAGRMQPQQTSFLFTCSAAQKLTDTL